MELGSETRVIYTGSFFREVYTPKQIFFGVIEKFGSKLLPNFCHVLVLTTR